MVFRPRKSEQTNRPFRCLTAEVRSAPRTRSHFPRQAQEDAGALRGAVSARSRESTRRRRRRSDPARHRSGARGARGRFPRPAAIGDGRCVVGTCFWRNRSALARHRANNVRWKTHLEKHRWLDIVPARGPSAVSPGALAFDPSRRVRRASIDRHPVAASRGLGLRSAGPLPQSKSISNLVPALFRLILGDDRRGLNY